MTGKASELDELLTVREAAALLKLTPDAIYSSVQRGTIPVRRLGRRLRFVRSEIEALLQPAPPARGSASR